MNGDVIGDVNSDVLPELCHLFQDFRFNGWGFDMKTDDEFGHTVSNITSGSPAETAELSVGDKILVVNGINVESDTHNQVQQRIWDSQSELRLMVIKNHAGKRPLSTASNTQSTQPTSVNANGADSGPTTHLCHLSKFDDNVSFGFTLEDGDNGIGHYIMDVEPMSPASIAGLRDGDRLLQVNGYDIDSKDHVQVVSRIKEAGASLQLLVSRNPRVSLTDDGYEIPNPVTTVQPTSIQNVPDQLNPEPERGPSATEISPPPYNGVPLQNARDVPISPHLMLLVVETDDAENWNNQFLICHLTRPTHRSDYGFDLQAIKDRVGHYILKVDRGSPAEDAGLKVGDRIMQVNGIDIDDDDHKTAVTRIKNCGDDLKFLVQRDKSEDLTALNQINPDDVRPRLCHLVTDENFDGWGFYMVKNNRNLGGHFIGSVDERSPAEDAGLKVGDRILEINGVNVENESHKQVVDRIKEGTNDPRYGVLENGDLSQNLTRYVLMKSPGFRGFGFTLESTKGTVGHYIATIQPDSMADVVGLKAGDRIIEVNGVQVDGDSHDDLVQHIKKSGDRVEIAVLGRPSRNRIGNAYDTEDVTTHVITPSDDAEVRKTPNVISFEDPRVNGDITTSSPTTHETPDVIEAEIIPFPDQPAVTSIHETEVVPEADRFPTPPPPVVMENEVINDHYADVEDLAKTPDSQIPSGPRICHLVKRPSAKDFGFNVVIKGKEREYMVTEVDKDSSADSAGLRQGDRILEVDGISVETNDHKVVVDHVRAAKTELKLLVVNANGVGTFGWRDRDTSGSITEEKNLLIRSEEPAPMSDKSLPQIELDLIRASLCQLHFLEEVQKVPELQDPHSALVTRALDRYEHLWLPLAAKYHDELLAAPLDIEWIWHCHMLAPVAYARDCIALVGRRVDHSLLDPNEREAALKQSETYWRQEYGLSEPFDFDLQDALRSRPSVNNQSLLIPDVQTAITRHRPFFYQVSLPHYRDRKFLELALDRYRQYLKLKRNHWSVPIVAPYDITLLWYSHKLHPVIYRADVETFLGHSLTEDDFEGDEITDFRAYNDHAQTRSMWKDTFKENMSLFGAMYRGELPSGHLYPLEPEDRRNILSKSVGIKLDFVRLDNLPSNVTRFQLEMYTCEGPFEREKVMSLQGSNMQFQWGPRDLKRFSFHGANANSLKIRLVALDGYSWFGNSATLAERSYDFHRFTERDIKDLAPIAMEYPFGPDGEYTISMRGLLGPRWDGPGYYSLRPGRFESRVISENNKEIWGPVPLTKLPQGNTNLCHIATHRLVDSRNQAIFSCRVIHSLPTLQSTVQVFFGDKLISAAHLVGLDQIPLPSQVQNSSIPVLRPWHNERAMLIKNYCGDWGLCIGYWEDDLNSSKRSSRSSKNGPSNKQSGLSIKVFHFPTRAWQKVRVTKDDADYRVASEDLVASLHSGHIKIRAECKEFAEHVALAFSVALLHVLCEPRTSDSLPVESYAGSEIDEFYVSLLEAAGRDVPTPSNHFVSVTYGPEACAALGSGAVGDQPLLT